MVDTIFTSRQTVAVLHEPPARLLPKLMSSLAHHHLTPIVVSHHHPDRQADCSNLYLGTYGAACRYLTSSGVSDEHRFASDLASFYGAVGLFISFSDRRLRGVAVDWLSLSNEASSTLLSGSLQPRVRLLKAIKHLFVPEQSIVINAVIDDADTLPATSNGRDNTEPETIHHLSAMSQQAMGNMFAPNLEQRGIEFRTVVLQRALCEQSRGLKKVIDPLINARLTTTD